MMSIKNLLVVIALLLCVISFSNATTTYSFQVSSSDTSNACNSEAANVTLTTCENACSSLFTITSSTSTNNFKFTSFSTQDCTGDYLNLITFPCSQTPQKISQSNLLISCIATENSNDSSDSSSSSSTSASLLSFVFAVIIMNAFALL